MSENIPIETRTALEDNALARGVYTLGKQLEEREGLLRELEQRSRQGSQQNGTNRYAEEAEETRRLISKVRALALDPVLKRSRSDH
jgi:hypothetical protein